MHLLVVRFSALGDILMTVPVLATLAEQYPSLKITVVSRPYVGSIFERLPSNVDFVGINPRNYKGLAGLNRMYKELKALSPTHVCDLHDVIRTKYLRWRFSLAGVPVSHINKDRKARKAFLEAENKVQQKTTFEKYAEALRKLDICCDFKMEGNVSLGKVQHGDEEATASYRIGIAPFAAHKGKIYPLKKMEQVVQLLKKRGAAVFLFGAGAEEQRLMAEWEQRYHVKSMVGTLPNMAAEMDFMSGLNAMLTMDSGNMHLAALTATPIYSIWGATHPLAGFLGWKQPASRCIQCDMPCRPCSIYGNKPCSQGDYPCLNNITPEEIVERIWADLPSRV